MRLTRRGRVVLAVALGGAALAWLFGARSLNAVVFPAAIVLVAAALRVRTLRAPATARELPPDGFPGDVGTVRLSFETGSTFAATVVDRLPDGLSGDPVVETTVGAADATYEVRYERRGAHEVGPLSIVAQDVLGLVEAELSVSSRDTLVVYPAVRELTPGAQRSLRSLHQVDRSRERDEFDRLREYERGDALRDIHWRSSAKRNELVVKEFAAESMTDAVTVAAGARPGRADEMAEAAASVAEALVSSGIPVTVSTPDGQVSGGGGGRLAPILEHLAVADHGEAPADADVTIVTDDGTRVRIGGEEWTFEAMTDALSDRSRRRVGEPQEVSA